MGVVAAMGGSSSVSLRGTNLPKPDSSPKILERSMPLMSDPCMELRRGHFCGIFSWSNEFFDVSVGENFKVHELFGEFDYIFAMFGQQFVCSLVRFHNDLFNFLVLNR